MSLVTKGLAAAWLATMPAAFQPAAAGDPPAVELGERRMDDLSAGERRFYALPVAAGDFARGTVTVRSGRAGIDLVTCEGRHLRRIASDTAGASDFLFVAETGKPCLAIHALSGPASVEVTLTRRVAAGERAAPERAFLSPAMAGLAASLAAGGGTEAFWAEREREGTPLVEPGSLPSTRIVTFLQRGATRNVLLFGAPGGDHDPLERLGTSDVWFRSYELPSDTRLSYQLAPDVPEIPGTARERRVAILATSQADPLNRHPWPEGAPDAFARQSTLTLPGAPEQPGLAPRPGVARGALREIRIASAHLGNERDVSVYLPPDFRPDDPRNLLLVVLDGRTYLSRVPTPRILDALQAEGRLPPTVAVFVDSIDSATRGRELPGNPDFANFLAGELLPRIRAETGLAPRPDRTILAGSSFGGLAAATVPFLRPDAFGNAIALSGSFWWHPAGTEPSRSNHTAATFAESARLPIRFFLSAGLFERSSASHPDGILETSRHLRDVLLAKGYSVSYREYAGGHDYYVWRGVIADGLLALFGRP